MCACFSVLFLVNNVRTSKKNRVLYVQVCYFGHHHAAYYSCRAVYRVSSASDLFWCFGAHVGRKLDVNALGSRRYAHDYIAMSFFCSIKPDFTAMLVVILDTTEQRPTFALAPRHVGLVFDER